MCLNTCLRIGAVGATFMLQSDPLVMLFIVHLIIKETVSRIHPQVAQGIVSQEQ